MSIEDDAKEHLIKAAREWADNHMDQFETFWIDSKYGPVFIKLTRMVPLDECQLYFKWEG